MLAAPAMAQDADKQGAEHSISVKLDPAFVASGVFDLEEEFVNKSEFTLAYKFKQPVPILDQSVSFTAGFVASPTRFDRGPEDSGLFAEVKFGESAIHVRELLGESALELLAASDGDRPENRGLKISPYVSFRHTEKFENFLGSNSGDNQVLGGGLEIRDLYSRVCWGERTSNDDEPLKCRGSKTVDGVSYAAAFDYGKTWSADPAEENDTYGAKAMYDLAPFRNIARLGFSASVNRIVFDSAVDGFGDLRRDWKYGGKVSLNFKPLLDRKNKRLAASVGVSQTWLESSDDSKDGSEFRVLASIGYTFKLN